MTEMPDGDDSNWRIDRKVPVALLVALSVQLAFALYWGGAITTRVELLEQQRAASALLPERITRLEAKLDNVIDRVSEIKALVTTAAPVIVPRR